MLPNPLHLFFPHTHNNHKAKILHTRSLTVLLGLFIMVQSSITIFKTYYPGVLGYASYIAPERIIELTNDLRTKQGLKPLKTNAKLAAAARAKAVDMFAKNYWAHNAPDGTKPWSFIIRSGYSYLHAGENLARDFNSPENVVQAWVNSPSHNSNLISPKYDEIGVAVLDGKLNGADTTLVVQMFGSPQPATPTVKTESNDILSQVYAQESAPSSDEMPRISPFDLSRSISLAFVILIIATLSFDWFVVLRRNLIRLSGKNWAHLTYLFAILIVLILLKQGVIL